MTPAFPYATWHVEAWVTAPGEFPSQSLEAADVSARRATGAIRTALKEFARRGLDPHIVKIERTDPPARQNP